jgi:hypothetical protein
LEIGVVLSFYFILPLRTLPPPPPLLNIPSLCAFPPSGRSYRQCSPGKVSQSDRRRLLIIISWYVTLCREAVSCATLPVPSLLQQYRIVCPPSRVYFCASTVTLLFGIAIRLALSPPCFAPTYITPESPCPLAFGVVRPPPGRCMRHSNLVCDCV